MSRAIDYMHEGRSLRGYFAPGQGIGARPGILIVPAWLGITDSIRDRADRLAAAGYSALAGDMFGHPVDIAAGPRATIAPLLDDQHLLLGRLRAGLAALVAQPEVDDGRLAAMGYCFGGHAVLELARAQAPLAGVVSFHGELDTPRKAKPGDIQGKLLVLTGDDDPLVPFEKVAAFRDEMRTAAVNFEIDIYSGAKHSFTGEGSLGPEKTPEAVLHPQAEARSWRAMMAFLDELFG